MADPDTNGPSFWVIDAFTSRPFAGNPAAVVVLDEPADADWAQAVAAEFNLAETAFVHPQGDAWRLRWFTPTVEVDLCGHATLASAHVLLDGEGAGERQRAGGRGPEGAGERQRAGGRGPGTGGEVAFETRSGTLVCRREPDGAIAMDFPADAPTEPVDAGRVEEAIGTGVVNAAAGRLFVVAELADVKAVDAVAPDLEAVAALGRAGLVVTARLDEHTVACRVFAPAVGIPEDPVTGSAWCALAPWWADRVGERFTGEQRSARGGTIQVALRDDRVGLAGHAVTVSSGTLQA